jgi:hypothetical protein
VAGALHSSGKRAYAVQKPRFVVACVAILPVALLTAVTLTTPATASGPGGWDHLGDAGTPGSDSLNGKVSALNDQVSGRLLVGGDFTDAGGNPNADRIAAWNGSAWSALSSASSQIGNGEVDAIAASGGVIYAGGTFQNAGGHTNADFLARWDGVSWAPFCAGTGLTGNVTSLQIVGPTLYVGGSFQNGAGIASADYLLACDLATGAPSSTIADPLPPFSGSVYALAADANGVLYAGGGFTNLEGIPAADNVAYLAGGVWHAMGDGSSGGCLCAVSTFVRSLTATGTDVYVGSDALNIAGIPQADHIARWNGSSWSALGANTAGTDGWFPTSASLNGLTTFLGSYLFATGSFLDANGDPRADNVAFFDGTAWHPVGSDGAGNAPWSGTGLALALFNHLAVPYSRQLYAGGNFTSAGGDPQAHSVASFHMYFVVPFPVPTPTPDAAAPVVRAVDLSVNSFRAARSGPAFAAVRVGTVVRFSLSEKASVKFTVQRPTAGRKVGGNCVKPTAGNRARPSCTRWVAVPGSVTKAGKKGANAMTFRGRMGGKTLKPGAYRLRMQATDTAKNASAYKQLRFTIVR